MQDKIIDIYPFLNYKNGAGVTDRIAVSANWIPEEHRRRLDAYTVLAAYSANMSNEVRKTPEDSIALEFGDANFVCTAMANAVVGDSVKIVSPDDPKREEFFRKWAADELFFAKLIANEYKASNIGDCVYRLNYSKFKGRTEVTTLDPGFWFPFNLGTKYEHHYFGWEEEDESGLTQIYLEHYERDHEGSWGPQNNIVVTAGYYRKGIAPKLTDLTLIRYAENGDGELLNHCGLGIDSFPIVWIPNVWREGNDFGESDLTPVYRILDQLSNTYSDERRNAWFMGLVQMWVDSETFDQIPLKKDGSKAVAVGENGIIPGEAGVVDNSGINDALMKYQEMLEKKLEHNTMLDSLSMTSSSGDRTTGIYQIKGGSFDRFIMTKRIVRQAKYDKLLRIVAKFEAALGTPEAKKIFTKKRDAALDGQHILFGNILPVDQSALLTNLQKVIDRLDLKDAESNIKESGLVVNHPLKEAQNRKSESQPEPGPAAGKPGSKRGA